MKKCVLVCGGRDFSDFVMFNAVMEQIKPFLDNDVLFVSGGARGADAMIINWCKARGYPCAVIRANWDVYGNSAGTVRNGWMLRLPIDLVVAFPGGRGTADMIKQSKAKQSKDKGIDIYAL